MALVARSKRDNAARVDGAGKRQRHRRRGLDTNGPRSLLGDDQLHSLRTTQHREFTQPLIVELFDRQSNQVFAGRADTNGPSRLQFAQRTADLEMLSAAEYG